MRMTLRRKAILICLAVGLSGALHAAPAPEVFYRQRVADAMAMNGEEQAARADKLLDGLLAEPGYQALSATERTRLLSKAALVAWQNDRLEVASQRYAELARQGSDNPDDWYRMAGVALQKQDMDAAAEAMTEFAARWPELLDGARSEVLYMLATADDTQSPARIGFQQALFDANWKGGDSNTPGRIWFRLARARVEQGDLDAARVVIRRIQEPEVLISLRADKRFDAVLDRNRARADVALALERQIEAMRIRSEVYPNRLEPILQHSYLLLLDGQNQAAIQLADDTIARITSADAEAPAFTDMEKQAWLMNNKAIALERMGQTDAAMDELRRAIALGGGGADNIGQLLNLGEAECALGNSKQAITVTRAVPVDGLSPYGTAVLHHTLHCAALLDNNTRAQKKALKNMQALSAQAPMPYLDALIQSDPEQAMVFVQQLLDAPDKRNDVLDWAQDCKRPAPMAGEVLARQRLADFMQRDDLRAAIEKVGRIEHYPTLYCHLVQ